MNKKFKILKNADVILENEILPGSDVLIQNGKIIKIGHPGICLETQCPAEMIDCTGKYLSPGFIDIHVHGGGGYDFMDTADTAIETILQTHTRYGTTSIFPTTLASEINATVEAVTRIEAFQKNQKKDLCQVMGVHLEGPYFNPIHKGAQPERFIKTPDEEEYRFLLANPVIKRISFAPEIHNALALAKYIQSKNIIGSIAHTNGTYDDVIAVMHYGINLITHLYSAMPVVYRKKGYRQIGIAETGLLLDDLSVEVIADGKHLPKELLRFIYKNKGNDKMVVVTDAMRAAGQNVTHSILGSKEYGLPVLIKDNVAFAPDGENFAGSIATMDLLVRNMVSLAGVSLPNAVKMAALNAAKVMHIDQSKGSIEKGKDADLVVLSKDLFVEKVIVQGNIAYESVQHSS